MINYLIKYSLLHNIYIIKLIIAIQYLHNEILLLCSTYTMKLCCYAVHIQ